VIAYGAGGALETVVPGVTGQFFKEQTADALAEVVRRFESTDYDPVEIRHHAEKFDTEVFKRRILTFIASELEGQKYYKGLTRDQGSGARDHAL